jgi:hypothetical protein
MVMRRIRRSDGQCKRINHTKITKETKTAKESNL